MFYRGYMRSTWRTLLRDLGRDTGRDLRQKSPGAGSGKAHAGAEQRTADDVAIVLGEQTKGRVAPGREREVSRALSDVVDNSVSVQRFQVSGYDARIE
jgi:hypothetical protein